MSENVIQRSRTRILRVVLYGLIAVLPAILVLGSAGVVEAQFQGLVNRVPRAANAVVILNVEKAKNSPMGLREDWKTKIEKAFEKGLTRVPRHATRFVLASQIDLEFFEPIWESAVVEMDQDFTIEQIAKVRGGELDTIEDVPAIARPNDTYLLKLGPKVLGAMGPANRQAVTRWMRETRGTEQVPLSPYLSKAATYSDAAGTEIIMAIDLDGALSLERLAKYLKGKEDLLAKWKADYRELSKLLAGVEGVRIGVRIGDAPSARVVVDLRDDASPLAPFAKPLLLEVLSDLGMSISDLGTWTADAKGREVSLSGSLTTDGLRRLMSVVDAPPTGDAVAPEGSEKPSPGELQSLQIKASLNHYHAVTAMFNDLKGDMKSAKNLASTSQFFDKYARRIEKLPILNVDEAILGYSAFVAQSLRQVAGSVRTMGIQTNVRQKQIISSSAGYGYAGYRYGGAGPYGAYGGAGYVPVYNPVAEMKGIGSERRIVKAEEKATMATDVQQIRDAVVAATADIRRKMTEKYRVEF